MYDSTFLTFHIAMHRYKIIVLQRSKLFNILMFTGSVSHTVI